MEENPAAAEPPMGLRAAKKARTRLAISDIATQLFVERGFERVTVAEIADAAQVSVKTVFNYFATKEDLFFDRADELFGGLTGTIRERPSGVTVVGALHRLLADNQVPFPGSGWGRLRNAEGYERYRAFVGAEHASPPLRARRLVLSESWAVRLGPVLAAELGLAEDDPRAATFAAMIIALLGQRERTLSSAVLAGIGARTVERRVRAVVDDACARLTLAFGDLDRPA